MRNYLQFQDNLTNNSINNLYLNLKDNLINQSDLLDENKKSLLNEEKHFIILSDKINSDFNNLNNVNTNKNKKNLINNYISIVNDSENIYNEKKILFIIILMIF